MKVYKILLDLEALLQLGCFIFVVKASKRLWSYRKCQTLKIEGDWGKLAFPSIDNPVQNVLKKNKKSSKVTQNWKILISVLGNL